MEKVVFKPKYSKKILASYVGALIFFLLTLLLIVIEWKLILEPLFWGSLAFWGIGICSFPFVIYKEIEFADQITVQRYLIRPWIIPYKNIRDITGSTVKLNRFHLVLNEMQNSFEFTDILFDQLDRRNQLDQIEDEFWKKEENGTMSAMIGISMGTSVSFLLYLVLGEVIPFPSSILYIAIIITIYLGFYHFNKKYYKSKNDRDGEPDYDQLNKKMDREFSLLFASLASGISLYLILEFDVNISSIHPKVFFLIVWIGAFLSTFFLSMLYFKSQKFDEDF